MSTTVRSGGATVTIFCGPDGEPHLHVVTASNHTDACIPFDSNVRQFFRDWLATHPEKVRSTDEEGASYR
jgi:hypothetical protein